MCPKGKGEGMSEISLEVNEIFDFSNRDELFFFFKLFLAFLARGFQSESVCPILTVEARAHLTAHQALGFQQLG